MTFLSVDVYFTDKDIYTPLLHDLSGFVENMGSNLNREMLEKCQKTLSTIYKNAPLKIRELIPTIQANIKKILRELTKYAKAADKSKRRTIREKIYELLPELQSDLGVVITEITALSNKEQGTFYANLPTQHEVQLSQFDDTGSSVETARCPVIVAVPHVLTREQMGAKCQPEVLESHLYLLKKAKLIGIHPSAFPSHYTEEKLESLIHRLMGRRYQVVPFRLKHTTSKRIWIMVDEIGTYYTSIRFADSPLTSANSEIIHELLNETDSKVIISKLLDLNFDRHLVAQTTTRLLTATDTATKHQILHYVLEQHALKMKTAHLRNLRLSFEKQQEELTRTIRLLQDDHQKTLEDKSVLVSKFKELTSPDAEPEKGLAPSQYKKLPNVVRQLERQQTRNLKDSYERRLLRRGLKEAQNEAKIIYYALKLDAKDNKKRLTTIAKLQRRKEVRREEARIVHGGQDAHVL